MAIEKSQQGIKTWKYCTRCRWAGKANDEDLALTKCPNCNNPNLQLNIDDQVYNGRSYGERVRNPKDQATVDAAREDSGQDEAPLDTDDKSNRGYQYE